MPEKKGSQFHIRLTADEQERWIAWAAELGLPSPSELIRRSVPSYSQREINRRRRRKDLAAPTQAAAEG
jgi:hypothetical protein